MLEPYEWKRSRTVLRRERASNCPDLVDYKDLCYNLGGDWINAVGGAGGRFNPLQVRSSPRDDENEKEAEPMRKYWTSDYAVNKDREGIVYQFADGSEIEISLAEYLQVNPDKTEQDFMELKALSDDIYHEQALEDTRYGKQKQALGKLEESEQFAAPSIDTLLIHKSDKGQALKAARLLLESGELTEVQRRRFIRHFFEGKSYRQLAALENVHFTSVQESIEGAVRKLKKYLKNF